MCVTSHIIVNKDGKESCHVRYLMGVPAIRNCTNYGVATISRLLKIIGLFCRISSLSLGSFAKETYHFKEPTNRSHQLPRVWQCVWRHTVSFQNMRGVMSRQTSYRSSAISECTTYQEFDKVCDCTRYQQQIWKGVMSRMASHGSSPPFATALSKQGIYKGCDNMCDATHYGVATISRLLKIIRLFWEYRSLL